MSATRGLVAMSGYGGSVVAGPRAIAHTIERERRERLHAAWSCTGWEWPDPRVNCDRDTADLAVAAAVLMAYSDAPYLRGLSAVGTLNLDGTVLGGGGVVWVGREVRPVGHLSELPAALADLAAATRPEQVAS